MSSQTASAQTPGQDPYDQARAAAARLQRIRCCPRGVGGSGYWEMTKRGLRHIRHDPEQLANVTLQPVLIVVLWLRVVTANQPITEAIDTLHALLSGQPAGQHLWLTLSEFAGIIVVAFALTTVLFKRTART